MPTIQLPPIVIRLVDGYSNTAKVQGDQVTGATSMNINTLGIQEVVPVSTRFIVVGSSKVYTVIGQEANALGVVHIGGSTGGTWKYVIAGNVSPAIQYNASAEDVLVAINSIPNVAVGDFTVIGDGSDNDPFIIRATPAGAYANMAVIMDADRTLLTGGSPSFTQVPAAVGGFTRQLTFTPALDSSLLDGALITISGQTVEVAVAEGDDLCEKVTELLVEIDCGWSVDFCGPAGEPPCECQ